jgi:hypothetical protein
VVNQSVGVVIFGREISRRVGSGGFGGVRDRKTVMLGRKQTRRSTTAILRWKETAD